MRFAEINTFITPVPVVSILGDRHIMQRHHRCVVICNHVFCQVHSCMSLYDSYKKPPLIG